MQEPMHHANRHQTKTQHNSTRCLLPGALETTSTQSATR
jgi:hypothetical protein